MTARKVRVEPFEKFTGEYDRWYDELKGVYESELLAVKEVVPGTGEGLEVGVGTGRFAGRLGVRTGVDPARNALVYARRRGVTAVQGVAENMPFRDSAFDFVMMLTAICFFENVPVAFTEASRVLRPGGALVVGFLDRTTPWGRKLEKERNRSEFFWAADFYSPEEVAAFYKRAGFGDVSFVETVFDRPDRIFAAQPPHQGCGEGLYVVAKGMKMTA